MSITIDNFEVVGWKHVIRGMRNPKNSWDKSDSFMCKENEPCESHDCQFDYGTCPVYDTDDFFVVGPNDHKLMTSLAKGGPVHAKYRRMVTVYCDITAPLYWWKEFDTYKVGTVANSCSTMHKIHAKEFTLDDFSMDHMTSAHATQLMIDIIDELNEHRKWFNVETDPAIKKDHWWNMIQLLPSSYNQKRTVMLNYEVLHNIYISRKNHKLDEWRKLRNWIERLPYSELITMEESNETNHI